MTLTAMLPSLRRSIPDPISLDLWPELTRATTTDVFVAGVSLLRVVDLFGTPCAHAAAAVVPGSGGCPSPTLRASAVVVRVTAVGASPTGVLLVEVDGRLGGTSQGSADAGEAQAHATGSAAIYAETRLIGRASTAKVAAAMLVDTRPVSRWSAGGIREWPLVHGLPADLAAGDLLAIPFRGRVHSWQLATDGATDGTGDGLGGGGEQPVASVESWLKTLA